MTSSSANQKHAYYFAFGSNMNPKRMQDRKAYFTDRCLAKLTDYEFVLNKKRVNKTAAANIRPKEESVVYGALYTCTEDTLKVLDKFEGVKRKMYYRAKITVQLQDGSTLDAITYIAHEHVCDNELKLVEREYLDHVLGGRDILPKDYVVFLESFSSWCSS